LLLVVLCSVVGASDQAGTKDRTAPLYTALLSADVERSGQDIKRVRCPHSLFDNRTGQMIVLPV